MLIDMLRLAARNLLRNRRRTAVTLGGLVLGVAAALLLQGFVAGMLGFVGAALVDARTGAIQIHKTGHLQADNKALDFALQQDAELERRILAVPGVVALAPRLTFEGTIGNGEQSTMALVTAVAPTREALVCTNRFTGVVGRGLSADGAAEGVLGLKLAIGLRTGVGGDLQLLATAKSGQPNLLDLKMTGRAPSLTEMDARRLVMIPLGFAQQLLDMPGQITEYAVAVEHRDEADVIAARLRLALGPQYEVMTWLDLMPQLRSLIGMLRGVMRGVVGVLLILLTTAVANTMWMSVHERVREIGTMMALGSRRQWILRLLVAEAAVLGLVGTTAGSLLGSVVLGVLGSRGLTFSAPGADIPSMLYPHVSVATVAITAVVVLAATLVAAAGPAWRASKLTPVECLRAT